MIFVKEFIHVSKANVPDSKGAGPLINNLPSHCPHIQLIKADQGYGGVEGNMKELHPQLSPETVRSNFGTTDFLPPDGRWVVERTISWFTGTRGMMRNYEKYLHTATNMAITCMVAFMLRYFRQEKGSF